MINIITAIIAVFGPIIGVFFMASALWFQDMLTIGILLMTIGIICIGASIACIQYGFNNWR